MKDKGFIKLFKLKLKMDLSIVFLILCTSSMLVNTESNSVKIPTFKLASGYEMPMLGIGTYRLQKKTKMITLEALDIGYRLIDTASTYMASSKLSAEEAIGEAIEKSEVPRKDIFIVTKVIPEDFKLESFQQSLTSSLTGLKTDYIDLLLLHYPDCEGDPYCKMSDTLENAWKNMEAAVDEGKVRSIGLSNSYPSNIEAINKIATKPISALQNWFDPFYQDSSIRQICKEKGIAYMGYSALGAGWIDDGMKTNPVFIDDTIEAIAKKHNTDVSSVVLKWAVQSNVIVMPGSTKSDHVLQNYNSMKLQLDEDDMMKMGKLDGKIQPLSGPPVEEGDTKQKKKNKFSFFRFMYGLVDVLLSYAGLGLPGADRDEL